MRGYVCGRSRLSGDTMRIAFFAPKRAQWLIAAILQRVPVHAANIVIGPHVDGSQTAVMTGEILELPTRVVFPSLGCFGLLLFGVLGQDFPLARMLGPDAIAVG